MREQSDKRRNAVRQAIANERLEGLEVADEARKIADNYIVGKADAEQAAKQIRARYGIE